MRKLIKTAQVIGQLLGVIAGDGVITASEDARRRYPYLWFVA